MGKGRGKNEHKLFHTSILILLSINKAGKTLNICERGAETLVYAFKIFGKRILISDIVEKFVNFFVSVPSKRCFAFSIDINEWV